MFKHSVDWLGNASFKVWGITLERQTICLKKYSFWLLVEERGDVKIFILCHVDLKQKNLCPNDLTLKKWHRRELFFLLWSRVVMVEGVSSFQGWPIVFIMHFIQ